MILHFCLASSWDPGAEFYAASSLHTQGFIHCSTVDQLTTPANLLARGVPGLVVLEIDPAGLPVRWEPGDPPDEAGSLFPHLYGPLPTSAVVAVHDFPPGPDGRFEVPRALRR
jgi:uncharacterized protein (DUF952 family)